jgi:hypothetical protein
MPENTVMPIDLRALAPAPVASISGTRPRMKANDVIRMGRRRERAASTADSSSGLPSVMQLQPDLDDQDGVFRRQRDQQDQAGEVVVDLQRGQHRGGAEQGQRHGCYQRDRRVPALILTGQHQIDQHRKAEGEWI